MNVLKAATNPRRNLSAYQRAELALKLEPIIAAKAKENERLGGKGSQKSANLKIDTRENLASIAGDSPAADEGESMEDKSGIPF